MERLQKLPRAPLVSLLSLAFLMTPQVISLHIRPQACYNSMGAVGTCMFVWECIKTEGKHLGTCADGFLFGSCCAHNDSKNDLIPVSESTIIDFAHKKPTSSSTTFQSSTYDTKENVTLLFQNSTAHHESFLLSEVKPTHSKPTVPTSPMPVKTVPPSRPTHVKPVPTSRPTYVKPVLTSRPTFVKPVLPTTPTSVKPVPPLRPTSVKPVPPTTLSSFKPTPTSKPTSVKPAAPSRPTSVKPVPPTRPTSVKPVPPSRTTSVKPVPPTRPTSVKPMSPIRPTSVKPVPPTRPTSVKPVPPSRTTSVKPVPPTRPTFVKPMPPSRPTSVKPVPPIRQTSVKPVPPSRTTSVKPVPPTRPTFVKPMPPSRPTSVKPVSPTRPTSVKPMSPSKTTFVKPVPPTRPTFVIPVPPSKPTYVKPTPPSRPIYIKPGSPSRPIYFKPLPPSRPTYFKPKPPSRPSVVKPVSHTSIHVNSTVSVTSYSKPSPTSRPPQTTSSQRPAEILTTRTPFTASTAATQGYSFVSPTTDSKGWFRPSGITSILVTNFPTKSSSTRRPQTTQRTTKYPFTQASWKPRPPTTKKPNEKPQIFTFTSYLQTQPSYSVSVLTTQSPNFHVPNTTTIKTTLPNSSELDIDTSTKPSSSVPSNSQKPITIYPLLTSPKTTTKPKVPFSTTFKPDLQSNLTSFTQYNWFTPENHKNVTTESPPVPEVVTQRLNTSLTEGNLLDEGVSTLPPIRPVPSFKPTKEPIEVITRKPWNPFFEFSTEQPTTVSSKTTTPLPITPCGVPNAHPKKKVVGGKNSDFGSWPWQVSVRRTSFFGFASTHRCGGALISRQWVATAGHCVDDLLLSQIKIRVGEYDFASVQEPHGYVERGAKKKVVHPRYNFFTYENDLALVELEEAIEAQKYPHISPICLPPSEENLVGKNATVTGWGRLSEGGVLPSILQEVQVPIISNEKCKNMFLAAGRHEYIPDIFMCAGFEEGGRDSCQGDSGGPLQIQSDEGYWFLAGIISWGIGCAEPNMPGVCTRISKFKDWVVQHIS